jgi:signal transduction histidine kinase
VTEVKHILECDRVVIYQAAAEDQHILSDEAITPTLTKRYETGLSGRTRDPIQQFIAVLSKAVLSKAVLSKTILHQQAESHAQQLADSGRATVLQPDPQRPETYLLAPILLPAASLSQPQVWGLLVACQDSNSRQWQDDEVNFVNDLANQLAIVLQQSEQLTQALTALESEKQLNALKSQLVTTISQEYRSPLAAILAAASTLKMHSNKLPEAKQQQFFQMIETKARQMTQLVDDLLVLETFESGQVNFTPQPFELLQFVSDLIDEYRQTMGQNHDLVFKITGNTRGFLGDRQLLRLILTNLLSNAINYSPESSEISVHLIGSDRQIQFEVRDEGIGIPPEDQAQVFQSFRRGNNVGHIPGTGVGLAIVKACVDLYGGTVALKSQVDQGTQVTVHLPKRSADWGSAV